MFDLRNRLYAHLQRMSLRFFTSTRSGEMLSRINNDVGGIQDAVTGTFTTFYSNLITVVTTVALMACLDWRLTLISLSPRCRSSSSRRASSAPSSAACSRGRRSGSAT